MNIKTRLQEENVIFVDNTKKQYKYFKIIFLFVIITVLFLLFVSLIYFTQL